MSKLIVWVLMFFASVVLSIVGARIRKQAVNPDHDLRASERASGKTMATVVQAASGVLFLILAVTVVVSTVVSIPVSHAAVIRNAPQGTARYVGPGWRFLNPLFETANVYDMRFKEYKIGQSNIKDASGTVIELNAVEASSNSPGLPVVMLVLTARARPSDGGCWCPEPEDPEYDPEVYCMATPDTQACDLVYIDIKHGEEGWVSLLLDRMYMNAKEVAGRNPYDYVGKDRDGFAMETLEEIREDTDGLANIVFFGIEDYDFSAETNAQLDLVAQKEREAERKEQEVMIETLDQQKLTVIGETAIIVAEKEAQAVVKRAEGIADATKLGATAEAFAILARAEAEAQGLALLNTQLANNPHLTEYRKWVGGWDGRLPATIMSGSDATPLVQLP